MAIHIALAKGRIHKAVMAYLQESGYAFPTYTADSRKLIFEDSTGTLKVTLVKSPDVAVYVERGAADVGIVGEDVLLEEAPGAGVYEIFDLGIGRCRMAVAAIAGKPVDNRRGFNKIVFGLEGVRHDMLCDWGGHFSKLPFDDVRDKAHAPYDIGNV